MSNFVIKGKCDDVIAKLKTTLAANDAQFNAKLNAIFQPAPAPKSPPKRAAKPPEKPAAGSSANEWGKATSRKRPDGGSMRSRLRG